MAKRRSSKKNEKIKRDIMMGAALTVGAAMAGLAIRGAMVLANAGYQAITDSSKSTDQTSAAPVTGQTYF